MQNGEDWGTVLSKYEDILIKFIEAFPETAIKDFPNSQDKEKITKEKVKRKYNKMKTGFRKAVDCGKKSGVGE